MVGCPSVARVAPVELFSVEGLDVVMDTIGGFGRFIILAWLDSLGIWTAFLTVFVFLSVATVGLLKQKRFYVLERFLKVVLGSRHEIETGRLGVDWVGGWRPLVVVKGQLILVQDGLKHGTEVEALSMKFLVLCLKRPGTKRSEGIIKLLPHSNDVVAVCQGVWVQRVGPTASIGGCVENLDSVVMAISIHVIKLFTEAEHGGNKLRHVLLGKLGDFNGTDFSFDVTLAVNVVVV